MHPTKLCSNTRLLFSWAWWQLFSFCSQWACRKDFMHTNWDTHLSQLFALLWSVLRVKDFWLRCGILGCGSHGVLHSFLCKGPLTLSSATMDLSELLLNQSAPKIPFLAGFAAPLSASLFTTFWPLKYLEHHGWTRCQPKSLSLLWIRMLYTLIWINPCIKTQNLTGILAHLANIASPLSPLISTY